MIETAFPIAFKILTLLGPVVAVLWTIFGPIIIAVLQRNLSKMTGIAISAADTQAIVNAVDTAAPGIYTELVTSKRSVHDLDAVQIAITNAANHVAKFAPDAIKRLGHSQLDIEDMIRRRFGKSLATDPNISISTAPVKPPVIDADLPRSVPRA